MIQDIIGRIWSFNTVRFNKKNETPVNQVLSYDCDSGQCLTGKLPLVQTISGCPAFTLPASRKVTATKADHHHRGKQECVQGTSHVELPSLRETRLFILWVAVCSLAVPTGDGTSPGADWQGCKNTDMIEPGGKIWKKYTKHKLVHV